MTPAEQLRAAMAEAVAARIGLTDPMMRLTLRLLDQKPEGGRRERRDSGE